MQILLIRHGKTRGNLEHRYVGRTDEGLSPAGIRELQIIFSEMTSVWPDIGFTCEKRAAMIASPMRRCIQTAEQLAQMKGWQLCEHIEKVSGLEKKLIFKTEKNLVEMDFGDFEYKNYIELSGNPDYQRYIDSGGRTAFPGGEHPGDFKRRCIKGFVRQVCWLKKQNIQCAIFVIHGGSIMALMEHFVRPHQDYFHWQAENGRGYAVTLDLKTMLFEHPQRI